VTQVAYQALELRAIALAAVIIAHWRRVESVHWTASIANDIWFTSTTNV